MNEPEQYQPNNPDERQGTAGAAPVSSSSEGSNTPQYGQYAQPEYGAMANQYPSGYNPYVYGAPEIETNSSNQQGAEARQPQQPTPAGYPYSQQYGGQPGNSYQNQNPYQNNPYGWNGNPQQQYDQQAPSGRQPRMRGNIDLNDPNQNPLYGHWDSYAILSLVFTILLPVPVVPALMGGVAMWRTKTFHMKGFWLGVAALVINVLYTIGVIWMAVHGISSTELYDQLLQHMLGGGSGSSESGSPSA